VLVPVRFFEFVLEKTSFTEVSLDSAKSPAPRCARSAVATSYGSPLPPCEAFESIFIQEDTPDAFVL